MISSNHIINQKISKENTIDKRNSCESNDTEENKLSINHKFSYKFYSNFKPRKNGTSHYKIYLDIINYSILSKRVVLNEYAVKIYFYNKPDKILYDDSPYGNNVELIMNIFENYYITLDRLFENMIEIIKGTITKEITIIFS